MQAFYNLFVIFILTCISLQLTADSVDSLKQVIKDARSESDYARMYSALLEINKEYLLLNDSSKSADTYLILADICRSARTHHEGIKLLDELKSNYRLTSEQVVRETLVRGSIYFELSEYDSAIFYTQQGLDKFNDQADSLDYALLLNLMGSSYRAIDFDTANKYIHMAIDVFLAQKDTNGSVLPLINLARSYAEKDHFAKAIEILSQANEYLDIQEEPIYRKMSYDIMAFAYIGLEDYKNGVKYLSLRDSVNFEFNNNQVAYQLQQANRERLRKDQEKQILVLNSKIELAEIKSKYNSIVIVLAGLVILVLVILIGYLIFRTKKKREEVKEINKKNQELESLNAFKIKVLSIISHDLRAPLTQVVGLYELKLTGIKFSEEEEKKIDLGVYLAAQNGMLMLDNLVKWAKRQIKGQNIELKNFDLTSMINDLIQQNHHVLEQKNQRVINNLNVNEILTDKDVLEIVIRNILGNAIKFSPVGGDIEIATKKKSSMIEISISDQGAGMSKKVMERLNAGVGVVSEVGTSGEKGAGFGLILTMDLISKIYGKISFTTNELGGTTATIFLPQGA